jgi:hypothetical protein
VADDESLVSGASVVHRARVGAAGGISGDPGAIPPSLGGYKPSCKPLSMDRCQVSKGKVYSIVYDDCGHFCGFVLDAYKEEEGGDKAKRRFAAYLSLI